MGIDCRSNVYITVGTIRNYICFQFQLRISQTCSGIFSSDFPGLVYINFGSQTGPVTQKGQARGDDAETTDERLSNLVISFHTN